ncbi:methionyl-tRNA formyltransferase [Mesorhizobium sp. CGMCC 1.15528]|uniref:Methionyl-tRNA formyltransferase n=2 Tax=Mesorhizobium zhangyense TaxID=1776730 RepID=A0A7C9R534_9HYPH|nr:methionyl-tRNA formyltransferase [Mesorhizobium zhangyense]
MQRMQLHDAIEAKYYVQDYDGRKLLQISTFGRATRDIPGKVSQTIQLDEEAASHLFGILKKTFDFK